MEFNLQKMESIEQEMRSMEKMMKAAETKMFKMQRLKVLYNISADIHEIESKLALLRQYMNSHFHFPIELSEDEADELLLDLFLDAYDLCLNPEEILGKPNFLNVEEFMNEES